MNCGFLALRLVGSWQLDVGDLIWLYKCGFEASSLINLVFIWHGFYENGECDDQCRISDFVCIGRRWVCGAIEVGWSGVRIGRKEKRESKSNIDGRGSLILFQSYDKFFFFFFYENA